MQLSDAVVHAQEGAPAASHGLLQRDRELARWVASHSADVSASRAELQAQRAAASGSHL